MATKKVPAKKSGVKKTVKDFAEKVASAVKPKPKVVKAAKVEPEVVIDSPPQVHVVSEPQIESTFSFDPDNHIALIPLIQHAWNNVKGPGDADFVHAVPDFRQTLLQHTLSALKGGITMEGDSPLANFEREILRLKQASNQ